MNYSKNIPLAKKELSKTKVHGKEFVDEYAWLKKRHDKETLAYLNQENQYFESVMKDQVVAQDALYKEMISRIKETDQTADVKDGNYFYYTRTEKGKQYSIYCRRCREEGAKEEILLDLNELAKGHAFFDLGCSDISSNHKLLAYSIDIEGDEVYTLKIKDLSTGKCLPDVLEGVGCVAEWAEDNKTLFYGTLDDSKRPYKIFRHELGQDQSKDVQIFEEEDEAYFVNLYKTQDYKFLVIESSSKNTSESHILEADCPMGEFRLFEKRRPNHEYSVDHHDSGFFILTNDQAENFRLMTSPTVQTRSENWSEYLPHRVDTKLEDMDIFKHYLVVYERVAGIVNMRVTDLRDNVTHYPKFEEEVYTIDEGNNPEYDTKVLRFHYSSLVRPHSAYDYDMETRTMKLIKTQSIPGGYDADSYITKRLMVKSTNGAEVPVSLVMHKDRKANGPLHLYGYGAYGITIDPSFSTTRLSLLNRGVAFAIAHIRGGGYLGRPWYLDGKLENKQHSFDDFINCADFLINNDYTTKENLIISGGSAGGLLVGTVLNQRPDLFLGAIMHVPFVDVVNTMLDDTLPLTVTEYDEWGDPHSKEVHERILKYSPYENIKAQNYPHIMVTAGLNDSRVQYWEPAKWVAKLRSTKSDKNLLLLKTHMKAGHGGPSGRYEYLKELALDYSFMFKLWNIEI